MNKRKAWLNDSFHLLSLVAITAVFSLPIKSSFADDSKPDVPDFKTMELVAPIDYWPKKDDVPWPGPVTFRLYVEKMPNNRFRFRIRGITKFQISLHSIGKMVANNITPPTCELRTVPNNDYILKVSPKGAVTISASLTTAIWKCGNIKFVFGSKHYKTKIGRHVTHLLNTISFKVLIPDKKTLSTSENCKDLANPAGIKKCAKSHHPVLESNFLLYADDRLVLNQPERFRLPWQITSALISLPTIQFKEVHNGIVEGPIAENFDGTKSPYHFVYEAKTPLYKESYLKSIVQAALNAGFCLRQVTKTKTYDDIKWPMRIKPPGTYPTYNYPEQNCAQLGGLLSTNIEVR